MTTESTGTATTAKHEALLRHDWSKAEVQAIYRTPLPDLIFQAQTIHRQFHAPDRVQTCQLISIKTGGCPEDCAYCPQSAHYDAEVERQGLLDPQHVISVANEAAGRGVARGAERARFRKSSGNGARRCGARHGSVLHAGNADRRAGGAAEGSRADGV